MSRKITSSLNTAHFFWSFPNGMAWTIWFSNRNFRFSQVNGKYPSTSIPARTNSQRDRGHKISEEKGPLLLHYLLQLKMVRSSNLLYRKRKTVSQLWHLSGARLCVKGALTNSPYVRLEPYVWRFLAPSTLGVRRWRPLHLVSGVTILSYRPLSLVDEKEPLET